MSAFTCPEASPGPFSSTYNSSTLVLVLATNRARGAAPSELPVRITHRFVLTYISREISPQQTVSGKSYTSPLIVWCPVLLWDSLTPYSGRDIVHAAIIRRR